MTRTYLAAMGIAFLIGAIVGPILGYSLDNTPMSFGRWLEYPVTYPGNRTGWWPWPLFTGALGAAVVYLASLMRRT